MERDDRRGFGVEAVFLGGMTLAVCAVALYAAMTTSFGQAQSPSGPSAGRGTSVAVANAPGTVASVVNSQGQRDVICACYNEGFKLAGGSSNVQSTNYRTGFSQCRALGDVAGGQAWTAGWDARRSGRPYEATCKAYKRRRR
ncbi:MAG: hypothetical protein AAGH42_02335 [Pseudomonadota bacterium]